MNSTNKKKLIYLAVAFIVLIILAIILTIKPWVAKPKSVKAVKIGNISVYTPVLSTDGQDIYYYDLKELNLFKYNLKTNKKTQLSNKMTDIPDLLTWSPDRANVIIRIFYDKTKFEQEDSIFTNSNIKDGNNTVWNYNIANQKITLLKNEMAMSSVSPNIINPIWTIDSKKIIYYHNDQTSNKYKLNMANFDGSAEQNLGFAPNDIFSIISYDNNNKIIYYSPEINNETEVGQIYKYNITTQKKELILDTTNNSMAIDDHRFIMSNNKQSFLYNTIDNSQKTLPILVNPEQIAVNPDKTKLLANIIVDEAEQFYIINLEKISVIKKLNPGIDNTGYTDLSLDSSGNIFFVNAKNIFEIKN